MQYNPPILYVEDDELSRKVMRILLQRKLNLTHVSIFEDSTDILKRAEALDPTPTLIMLDIHMKPYSGFEVLEMFRQSNRLKFAYILALTASVMQEEVQQLREAGFDGCISKPVDSDRLTVYFDKIMRGESVWEIYG